MKQLADKRANFAFETTLATKSFASWIRELKSAGYILRLIFLWLPSPEESIQRVHSRKQSGGHFVPDDTVRRRYQRGLDNFFTLYQPMADSWKFYNNSQPKLPVLLAEGEGTIEHVSNAATWIQIKKDRRHGEN